MTPERAELHIKVAINLLIEALGLMSSRPTGGDLLSFAERLSSWIEEVKFDFAAVRN